ncbi:MAG: restriction endonuclease [Candidatus Nomurabacteria bacterium]|jgi:type II restriction enzyme|nr:restriction endonuclease [Candidatus Nomurabacteria bacterium]
MANSDFLRNNINQHIIKNSKSKKMDRDIIVAINAVIDTLRERYPQLTFEHQKTMRLVDIIATLSRQYPEYAKHFGKPLDNSFISPDGGFLFAKNKQGERRIILVSEVKRQGTNDARKLEGLPKQAQGNAIERLGKNLIGIRAIFKNEGILPFVCFGSGYDFKPGSSILDRVLTMNEFFPLNKVFVKKDFMPFEPVSMLFQYNAWSVEEMAKNMFDITVKAIEYKFV